MLVAQVPHSKERFVLDTSKMTQLRNGVFGMRERLCSAWEHSGVGCHVVMAVVLETAIVRQRPDRLGENSCVASNKCP